MSGITAQGSAGGARDRLIDAAYDLFSQNGVQAVGVDAVLRRSGVARQTLYRHFESKENLVLAFLDRREVVWTRGWLQSEVLRRETDPVSRLLAIFDVFDEWFRAPDFEGCVFINVMLEFPDPADPVNRAGRDQLAKIREFIGGLAGDAGIADPDAFARDWHILMKGSIVAAGEGDVDAAVRGQAMGRMLLDRNGISPSTTP